MKTIYKELLQRLKNEVAELNLIDYDYGQLEVPLRESERPPVRFPCALLSVELDSCQDIDEGQYCEATVVVRIACDVPARTSSATPPAVRDKHLEPYEIVAKVHKALQGYQTAFFDPLTRRRGRKETSDRYFIYRLDYHVEFDDIT